MQENQEEIELLDVRVRRCYENMPPSERRLADLLLNYPSYVIEYSASELSDLAKTSNAAATRFFRRLGYKDFNDARRQTREAKEWGAPLYQTQRGEKEHKTPMQSKKIGDHIHREITNLQRTIESVEPAVLRTLSEALITKQRIMVVGYRNSRFLAEYLQRQLSLIRPNVSLHPQPGQSIAEELFDIGEQDLLFVIGMRRRTPFLRKVVEFSIQRQVDIALLADPTAAVLEKQVKWKLPCIVHSTSAFDSYSSVMSLITLLINTVIENDINALARLREIESSLEELEELNEKGRHTQHPANL